VCEEAKVLQRTVESRMMMMVMLMIMILPSSPWLYSPWETTASHVRDFFNHLDTRQDSFGRVISPSQRSLPTKDNIIQKDKVKHPCLKRDSNPNLSVQEIKAHASDSATNGTGELTYTVFVVCTRHCFCWIGYVVSNGMMAVTD
jgi:hypothetical protein